MIKNFSKQPNAHFLNEEKTNQFELDYRQDYVLLKLKAMQDKYGRDFQKSQSLMANICNMSKSTFIRISEELINRGYVTKRVVQAESKNNESCYWTINFEWEFEELSTTLPQNDNTHIQNDNGVLSEWQGGIVNMTKKEDVLRSFKDLSNSNIYKPRELHLINNYLESKEIAYMKDFLMNKGFSRGIIEEIAQSVAIRVMQKAFALWLIGKDTILNTVVQKYSSDVNNPNAKFFLYKLEKEIELFNLKKIENDEKIRQYEEAIE